MINAEMVLHPDIDIASLNKSINKIDKQLKKCAKTQEKIIADATENGIVDGGKKASGKLKRIFDKMGKRVSGVYGSVTDSNGSVQKTYDNLMKVGGMVAAGVFAAVGSELQRFNGARGWIQENLLGQRYQRMNAGLQASGNRTQYGNQAALFGKGGLEEDEFADEVVAVARTLADAIRENDESFGNYRNLNATSAINYALATSLSKGDTAAAIASLGKLGVGETSAGRMVAAAKQLGLEGMTATEASKKIAESNKPLGEQIVSNIEKGLKASSETIERVFVERVREEGRNLSAYTARLQENTSGFINAMRAENNELVTSLAGFSKYADDYARMSEVMKSVRDGMEDVVDSFRASVERFAVAIEGLPTWLGGKTESITPPSGLTGKDRQWHERETAEARVAGYSNMYGWENK